uniref:Uncharacterized protein n=1 Tax=Pelusios castaneus TaxID=367368 RepID=A0A8C8R990_9SAUR
CDCGSWLWLQGLAAHYLAVTLQEQVRQLSNENTALHTQHAVHGPESEPALALPQQFVENSQQFQDFMNQCHLLFLTHPQIYASDQGKVALVISLLTGDALAGLMLTIFSTDLAHLQVTPEEKEQHYQDHL